MIRTSLALYVLMTLLYLFVLPEQWQANFDIDYAEPVLLLLLIALFIRATRTSADANQRTFWKLLTLATGAWLAVSIVGIAFKDQHFPALELVEDCIFLIYYGGLAVTIELRLDRPRFEIGLQRYATAALGSVLLVFALFGYFAIVPLLVAASPYSPPYALHGLLDAYICGRFLVALMQTRNSSWRRLYALFSVTFALIVVADLLAWAYTSELIAYRAGSPLNILWFLWYPVAMFATGIRLDASRVHHSRDDGWQSQLTSSGLLGFGIALPFLHVLGYALGWFSLEFRLFRDVFVAVWIIGISGGFFGLYLFLYKKIGVLDGKRADAEHKVEKLEDQLNRELRLRSFGPAFSRPGT